MACITFFFTEKIDYCKTVRLKLAVAFGVKCKSIFHVAHTFLDQKSAFLTAGIKIR